MSNKNFDLFIAPMRMQKILPLISRSNFLHMRNFFSKFFFTVIVWGLSKFSDAQLKDLTADQMLHGKTEGILKPLPKIGGWKDDTHYILYKQSGIGYDTVLTDVT